MADTSLRTAVASLPGSTDVRAATYMVKTGRWRNGHTFPRTARDAKAGEFDIAGNSDQLPQPRARVNRRRAGRSGPDRASAGDHCFINDRNPRCVRGVGGGERPSAKKRNSRGPQVVRTDHAKERNRSLVRRQL